VPDFSVHFPSPLQKQGLFSMPTATATTKATTAALEARVLELETQVEDLRSCELRTTVWINDRVETGKTQGGKPYAKFSGQKSVKTADGKRVYGCYHNFVAYGDMADAFINLRAQDRNLLTITAFESPWSNGARKSDWVVTSITPFERPEAGPATEAGEPFSQEPTDEEVQL
jgi:hypothetical protein